jgi:hypothetical protein
MAPAGRRTSHLLPVVAFLLSWNATALAAPPPPDTPPPAVTPAPQAPGGEPAAAAKDSSAACYPPCRAGYLCHEARCVSICNPPCLEGQSCVDGTRCEAPVSEPPPPPMASNSFMDRSYSALAFHMGFAGSVERNGVSRDLAATLGVNLRADIPVVRYLLVGPLIQFGAWRTQTPSGGQTPDHNYYLDIDLYVRGRIPIQLDTIGLSVWGGVPIGLTMDFLGDDEGAGLDGFAVGWNVGAMAGAGIHFTKKFGMFTEFGWMQHKMSHDFSSGSGSADFWMGQGVFNIGFIIGD